MHLFTILATVLLLTPIVDECPRVIVRCPTEALGPGAHITFTADISGGDAAVRHTYHWTVSAGTITNGQGSSEVTVDTTGLGSVSVTATVEIGEFPDPCAKTASCAVPVTEGFVCRRPVDEYGNIIFTDEQARLDNFAIELQNNPGARGYIIAYAGRRTRPGKAQGRGGRAKRYLVNRRGIEAGRVMVIDGGYREEMTTQLYIAPDGAEAPAATPTVDPSEVQLTGDKVKGRRRVRN